MTVATKLLTVEDLRATPEEAVAYITDGKRLAEVVELRQTGSGNTVVRVHNCYDVNPHSSFAIFASELPRWRLVMPDAA